MINPLEELKKSLLNMTTEERMEKMREVREDRKVSKFAVTVAKKRKQDRGDKLQNIFADLTPEEQKALLEQLKA